MAVVERKVIIEDNEEAAFQLQLQMIAETEEKRKIAEQDEAMATHLASDQYVKSRALARIAVEDAKYAASLQAGEDEKGMDLYTQYPGLDIVKGDKHVSSVPSRVGGRNTEFAAASDEDRSEDGSVESPYNSPKGSPKKVPAAAANSNPGFMRSIGNALGITTKEKKEKAI